VDHGIAAVAAAATNMRVTSKRWCGKDGKEGGGKLSWGVDRPNEMMDANKCPLGMDEIKAVTRGGVRSFASVPLQYFPAHLEMMSGRIQGGGQGYAKNTRKGGTSKHLCPADFQWAISTAVGNVSFVV